MGKSRTSKSSVSGSPEVLKEGGSYGAGWREGDWELPGNPGGEEGGGKARGELSAAQWDPSENSPLPQTSGKATPQTGKTLEEFNFL